MYNKYWSYKNVNKIKHFLELYNFDFGEALDDGKKNGAGVALTRRNKFCIVCLLSLLSGNEKTQIYRIRDNKLWIIKLL